MNIKNSMSGFVINERYEIFENVHGDWRIYDLSGSNFISFGGTPLFLDNKQKAIDFLIEEHLV